MEDRIVSGNFYDNIKPGEEPTPVRYSIDLDRTDENYAWQYLNSTSFRDNAKISRRSQFAQLLVTKTIGLLVVAGFRPILREGNHDEIIFGYEQLNDRGESNFKTISVPISGATIARPAEFTKLMAQVDEAVGFNVKSQNAEAPLEDRLEQLNEILLEKFKQCNDVDEEFIPRGRNVYSADWLTDMAQKYNQQAQQYVQEHPELDGEVGSFEDSVAHGNTDVRILTGKEPSFKLAIESRDYVARITQAEMLRKPAIGLYVNKQDEYRNEDTDLREFVGRRLRYLSKLAKQNNASMMDTKTIPDLDKYSPIYNPDQNREQ